MTDSQRPENPTTAHEANLRAIETAPPIRRSPWSTRDQIRRFGWSTLGRLMWKLSPGLRPVALRLFGAKVGTGCSFARSVKVVIPWNLNIGANVDVAARVTLYALGQITVEDDVAIDCRAHLCAGSHDVTHPRFPQTRPNITIGRSSYIGIDAYIAPGVTIGSQCTIWHRASVYKDVSDNDSVRGNPAKRIEPEGKVNGWAA